ITYREYRAGGTSLGSGEYSEKFQWMRDGKAIKNATGRDYTVVSADVGKKLTVKVTFSKPGYLGSSKTSLATPKVGINAFDDAPDLHEQYLNTITPIVEVNSGKIVLKAPTKGAGVEG